MLPSKWEVVIGVVGAVALLVGVFLSGWQVRDWQADAEDLARMESEKKADKRMQELAERMVSSTNEAIASIRIENRTIYQKATHEVQTNTIYSDELCRVPDGGVQLINQARAAANAAGTALPAAAANK